MKTIALRFGEHFAPPCGTVAAHQELIDKFGYVWYGKLGSPVSQKIKEEILATETPKFLLISSGKADRYWAYVEAIQRETPPIEAIPEYYRDMREKFKTWLKIIRIEQAPKNIMAQCTVASSGSPLTEASKHSMSPYFIINTNDKE